MGVRGTGGMEAGGLPNRRLRPPPGGSLVTFWPSRKSLAAGAVKLPVYNKPIPKLAPSSAPFGGTFPPGGRLFKGSAPHPPRFRSAPSPGKGEGKKEAKADTPQ